MIVLFIGGGEQQNRTLPAGTIMLSSGREGAGGKIVDFKSQEESEGRIIDFLYRTAPAI